jgi:hypothetical protein
MPSAEEGLLPDPQAPEPGNEKPLEVDPNGNGGDVKKKRRRRGGRRHRARRERAAARAAAEAAGIPYVEQPGDADDRDDAEGDESSAPESKTVSTDEESNESSDERKESPKRIPPQVRVPQPPVVKTGTADKHLADDEPIDPIPAPRRPRSRIDLDAIPDDFD